MPIRLIPLLALVLAALAASPAAATVHPDARVILHLVPVEEYPRRGCDFTGPEDPTSILTRGEVDQTYLAYVLVAGTDTTEGVSGVQFGISYDDSTGSGVEIEHWQRCSLFEWAQDDWPRSHTGIMLTWAQSNDCQTSNVIVAGFFYLVAKSPDRMRILPRPADNLAAIAACRISALTIDERVQNLTQEDLGWVDFGEGSGYNPWDPDQNLELIQKRFKPLKP